MMKRMITKREFMENVITGVEDADMVAFAKETIAKMDAANAHRKPTAKQKANQELEDAVFAVIESAGKAISIAEIKAGIPELADASSQKVSSLLTALKKAERVKRVDLDKKVAGFAIVGAEPVEVEVED